MKRKILTIMLCCTMAFILAACSGTQNNGVVNASHNSDGNNAKNVDAPQWDADVLQALQGAWVYEDDAYRIRLSISGRDCSLFIRIRSDFGTGEGTHDLHMEPSDVDGELILYSGEVEEGRLYYKYNNENDSMKLSYDGKVLEKED